MKIISNSIDNFDENIKLWQNDEEKPNPFLASKIIENIKQQKHSEFDIIPFRISKFAIATMLIFGLFSGYFLHILTEQPINNQDVSQSNNEAIMMKKYTSEMYITEIKQSEIEDFFRN